MQIYIEHIKWCDGYRIQTKESKRTVATLEVSEALHKLISEPSALGIDIQFALAMAYLQGKRACHTTEV